MIKHRQPATSKNLQLIQLLRGIAAMLVVLLHATRNCNESFHTSFLFNFFDFGGAGVDIFFVLSGFIITYTSLKFIGKTNGFNSFVRRRVVRIYPTYWIIISIFLLLQVLLPAFYRSPFNFTPGNILSTYVLLPGHEMVNGVSWTLSYEIFFYFLFSLSFFISNRKLSFILAAVYAIALIILPLTGAENGNGNTWLELITYPMNVEFFMGILVAVSVNQVSSKIAVPFIILGSSLFLTGGIISNLNYMVLPNTFNRVILFGIPSFFIILGLVKYELTNKVNLHNIFLLLGEASYSLYLLHLPLIVAAFKILSKFNAGNSFLTHIIIFVIVCIICYASIIFYKFVEKPIITKLNSLRRIKVANEI